MSSVIESCRPPIDRSALIRTALFVPTSMAMPRRLPARCSSEWNRYCCDSAQRVTTLS